MFRETLHPDGVLELVIDQPPVNAFGIGFLHALSERLERAGDRPEVRVVLLRAAGRGFCGGGDVKEVETLPGFEGILGQASGALRVSLAALTCAVPVISAVHNYCIGVGVLLAGSSDIVLASAGTRFVLAEIDNGATAGAVQALRLMPEKRLRAAMMTAAPVFAEELHQFGSIYKLTSAEGLEATAMIVAKQAALKNPRTMKRLKLALNATSKASELQTLYRSELSYTYELNIMGDASEGRSAFITGEREGYTK